MKNHSSSSQGSLEKSHHAVGDRRRENGVPGDVELPNEDFMAQLNMVVNHKTVGDFFSVEEEAEVVVHVRPLMKQYGLPEDHEECWKRFLESIRNNFRVVLCMQPKGDGLRARLRSFPSLVSCTEIGWHELSLLRSVRCTLFSLRLPCLRPWSHRR